MNNSSFLFDFKNNLINDTDLTKSKRLRDFNRRKELCCHQLRQIKLNLDFYIFY